VAADQPAAVFRAVLPLAAALDSLRIPYAITGSLASGLHGETRSTRDADVVVDLGTVGLDPLLNVLMPEFYVPSAFAREAVAAGSSFNVIHLESQYKVDLYPAGRRRLDEDLLRRRVFVRHPSEPDRELAFVSAEVIVLAKLDWYRRGEGASDQQWRDVKGVLKVQGARLDLDYIRRRAVELGLGDLLQQALVEAGLVA
jgi:hypothetical protein